MLLVTPQSTDHVTFTDNDIFTMSSGYKLDKPNTTEPKKTSKTEHKLTHPQDRIKTNFKRV